MTLERPLLLEGEAGVGKTELAKALSAATGGELIRLQCYEGIDVAQAVYDWDYRANSCTCRAAEATGETSSMTADALEAELYGERFMIKRALLRAIEAVEGPPPVLLIDEVDRADDEFEAYLLEILSDFQVTVPEVGVFRAERPPLVVLTSNRTRDVHDALKRRCLYHWVEHPGFEREVAIVKLRVRGRRRAGPSGGGGGRGPPRAQPVQATRGRRDDRLGQRARAPRCNAARRGARHQHPRDGPQVPRGSPARRSTRGRRRRQAGLREGAAARVSWAPPSTDDRALPQRSDPAEIAVAFTRVLRGAGLRVPSSSTHTFAEALCAVGLEERAGVYWSGRATLARRPEDIEVYDRAFAVFFDTRRSTAEPEEDEPLSITIAVDSDDEADDDGGESGEANDDPTIELRFSTTEVLRHKDFAQYSPDELVHAHDLMASLRLVGSPRSSLRLGPARRSTIRPDIRRTMQAAIRSGGEPIERHFRQPRTRLRRLVLLLDVSGSMEPYARALLRFVHAAVAGRQKVEAFALGTRLEQARRPRAERPRPRRGARRGVRAGHRLERWNPSRRRAPSVQRRVGHPWAPGNSIVVVLSDGWDRGDPDTLADQMERLHRVTHRLVWVNPLKVTPGYAPLAHGDRRRAPARRRVRRGAFDRGDGRIDPSDQRMRSTST